MAAAAVLVIGLTVVFTVVRSDDRDPFTGGFDAPTDVRPPLARMCPPPAAEPTGPAGSGQPSAPPGAVPSHRPVPLPSGATWDGRRTVDEEAGISYPAYGKPWQPWTGVWSAGDLQVPYRRGQHFITEPAYDGHSDYHASILSAAVPATENDALTLDLECVGRQVAADARAEYYPQPTRMELIRDGRTTLGGRPAWVTLFRLHFSRPGLRATNELVGIACIDVGRTTAAVLYVSIPDTHRQFDWVVEHALASVQPI